MFFFFFCFSKVYGMGLVFKWYTYTMLNSRTQRQQQLGYSEFHLFNYCIFFMISFSCCVQPVIMTLDYFQNEFKMVNFYVKAVMLYGTHRDKRKEE